MSGRCINTFSVMTRDDIFENVSIVLEKSIDYEITETGEIACIFMIDQEKYLAMNFDRSLEKFYCFSKDDFQTYSPIHPFINAEFTPFQTRWISKFLGKEYSSLRKLRVTRDQQSRINTYIDGLKRMMNMYATSSTDTGRKMALERIEKFRNDIEAMNVYLSPEDEEVYQRSDILLQ
jgi:hypothetical protein